MSVTLYGLSVARSLAEKHCSSSLALCNHSVQWILPTIFHTQRVVVSVSKANRIAVANIRTWRWPPLHQSTEHETLCTSEHIRTPLHCAEYSVLMGLHTRQQEIPQNWLTVQCVPSWRVHPYIVEYAYIIGLVRPNAIGSYRHTYSISVLTPCPEYLCAYT